MAQRNSSDHRKQVHFAQDGPRPAKISRVALRAERQRLANDALKGINDVLSTLEKEYLYTGANKVCCGVSLSPVLLRLLCVFTGIIILMILLLKYNFLNGNLRLLAR